MVIYNEKQYDYETDKYFKCDTSNETDELHQINMSYSIIVMDDGMNQYFNRYKYIDT